MKRYKKESTLEKLVKKYKLVYFLSYSVGFLILSIIVGGVLFFAVNTTLFDSAKNTIDNYLRQYVEYEFKDDKEIRPGEFPGTLDIPRIMSPTMAAVVYYTDESGEIVEYNIIGADFNEDYKSAIEEEFYIERKVDKYVITALNGEVYLTKMINITNSFYIKEGLNGYVKVYDNVDAEYALRGRTVSIYSMISIAIFVASLGLGLIVMKQNTKPLKVFVEKQTNFVSDASHELRTPLAVVQSKIETVLSQPDKNVCDVSEDLAIALNEISRLTKLTNELLTLARNDKDNIEINLSAFDANEELKTLVEPFSEIASFANKKLTYDGMPCMVKLDKDKFKQIMIINIDNALKYTEENDEINISLKSLKDEIEIKIADTGIGLSDENKSKIFERFYRADKARSRETGGNGLGLSIAYTLVKLQKGNISVYDNEPKGTKFVITFPKLKQDKNNKDANN